MTSQMLLMMNAGNSGAGTQQTRHRGERVFQEHYCSVLFLPYFIHTFPVTFQSFSFQFFFPFCLSALSMP